ncbi:T9SS type B sorting domain-containing protein [Aquimarina brevivitae]|uniref:Gliding motility-associated-like protein n=1 Tax=Aquimarina brevivitae TaxID=323412 RepID=A0A4Q7PK53_9FLAO|nr:T9SS type B sorting domain-containing protein [Aquimarina brevivitae]RZS99322.1 gliding motility-associated-like protein [Aquimarina brevivitae]
MSTQITLTNRLMKTILYNKVAILCIGFLMISISNTMNAQVTQAFDTVPEGTINDIRGDLIMTGNDIVGMIDRNGTSYDPNAAYNGTLNNGNYTTAFIDIDGDPSTFSSSSADLNAPRNECSRLVYAGLYWSANYYMQRDQSPRNYSDNELGSNNDTNVNLTINNGDIAEEYNARYSEFDNDNSDIRLRPVTSYLVVAQPVSERGCSITNADSLVGNIAVIRDGGSCSIREKVVNAQNAGALGVVIVNDNNGNMPRLTGNGPAINIPAVSIGNDDIDNHLINNGDLIDLLLARQPQVFLATLSTEGNPILNGLPTADPRKLGPADFRDVKLRLPNGTNYIDISATDIVFDGYRNSGTNPLGDVANDEVPYVCYADITQLLDPNNYFGTYTVADMNATHGFTSGADGACGGWFIVAIYEDPLETAKYISTSNGFVQIFSGGAPVDFLYSGFTTLGGNEPIDVRYGVASLEGDTSLGGDQLRVENTNGNLVALGGGGASVNPNGNFFNGSISEDDAYITARVPASENTQGFDMDIFNLDNDGNGLIGNGQSSARFQIATNQDRYSVFFNAFSVTIIEPELRIVKRVYDTDGVTEITGANVELGDELFYDLEIENIGNEDFVDGSVVITDILPPNTDLVSIQDATLPPGVTYAEVSPGVIEFYIPSEIVETRFDDPVGEGDGPIFIRFRARLVASCEDLRDACSDIIENSASATYTGLITGNTRSTLSTAAIGACGDSNPVASNVLVNVPACEQDVTFCNDDLTLVAGTGYDLYTWSGPGISPPVQTTVNFYAVPNPQSGVYTVVKEDTDPSDGTCMTLTEEFTVTDFNTISNPILDYVNGTTVVTEDCSGLPIPQILLCGNQSLELNTNFDPSNLDSISWQRLSPSGACISDPNDPCSLLSGDCTDANWVEEPGGNTPVFTVTQAGDYRILAEFDGGCFIPFYFSVFRNDYQPQLTMNPIECGNDGSVTVTNVPDNFAFSLTPGGPYNNTTGVFPISTGGDITVYAIDTTFPGCEYTATINVPTIDPSFSVTAVDPSCINDNNGTGFGRINISVTGGIPEYQYTISSPALGAADPIIVPNSSANNGNYTQNNLPPGNYTVEVISNRPAPECLFTTNVTINPATPFEAEVVLLAPETCTTGALVQVNVTQGSGNYSYADSSGVFRNCSTDPDCNIFELPIPADPNTVYTFQVSDLNVPAGEAACIIEASIDNINPYNPIVIDAVTPTNPICPTDAGQIRVEVSPQVTGRNYLYELLTTATCAVNDTTYTVVDQINSPLRDVTFTNVADFDCYRVRVSHENTTPPGTTPPTICPVISDPVAIQSPTPIDASVVLDRGLSCIPGNEDAVIQIVSATGGTGSYAWSFNPSGSYTNITSFPVNIPVNTAGTYTIYIANQNAGNTCPISRSVTVDPLATVDDLTFTENSTNCTAQTVEVTVSAVPVGPTYTYSVTPAPVAGDATTGVFTLDRGTVYTFTAVRTDNQCEFSESFTRDVLPEIDITNAAEASPVICTGDSDGSLSFTVANTTDFDWVVTDSGGATVGSGTETGSDPTTVTVTNLPAGDYDIAVTDTALTTTSACTDTATVTITEPVTPLSFTTTATESSCTSSTGTITVTATGGRGNYQYRLDDSGGTTLVNYPNTNNVFTGLAAGTYTIFVRDGNDPTTACEVTATETIVVFASPTIALAAGGDQCYDGTNQASQWITITPGVATPVGPFEYSVDGGTFQPVVFLGAPAPANTFEIDNLAPGTYSVVVRNTNTNCSTAPISFTINPELTITANLDKDIDCNGGAEISFTAAGGSGTYTQYDLYDYNGGSPTLITTGITSVYTTTTPGEYVILVTDDLGCTAFSNPVTVTAYTPIAATATATNPDCPAEDGSVTVTVTAGEGPFTYVLDGNAATQIGPTGSTTVTFNNVAVGTHTVTITDGVGGTPACTEDVAVDVIAPTPITANIAITQDYRCDAAGSSTTPQLGEITVSGEANGDPSTYEYSIDGVNWQATPIFPGLTDGTYTLYIRDANTISCPVNLGQLTIDPLVQVTDLAFAATQVQCPGLTADVTLTPTLDGTSNVQYEIIAPITVGPQTSNVFTGLTSGTTYTFLARTDTDGCTYTETFTVPEIDFIAVNGSVVSDPSCNGAADGEISFTVSGIDLTATTYAYQITEGGGAVGPFTATGQTTATINTGGLPAGVYTVEVTDETTLCTDTTTITLTDPAVLTATAAITAPLTCVQNATITVTVSGGNGGYQYELFNSVPASVAGPQASNVFSVGTADTYEVVVTDAEGCTVTTAPVTVTVPTPVTATVEATSDRCYDPTNQASLDITINTGTAPYTYSVNGGSDVAVAGTTFTVGGLTPGNYAIVITDANGCEVTINETIQPQITIAASLLKDLDCSASPGAQIQVTTTGGNGGNTFEVNVNGGGFVAYGGGFPYTTTTAGTYQFRVTDSEGCQATSSVITVTPAPNPVATETFINPTCNGDSDGSVTITVDTTVGTAPYEIDFNGLGFSNQTTYGGLPEGTYNYTVRDAKGCTDTFTVTLSAPAVVIGNSIVTDITCSGAGTTPGSIELENITGGVPPYDVSLLNAADLSLVATATPSNPVLGVPSGSDVTFGDLIFGDYIFRVIDSNGCTYDFPYSISTEPIFTINASVATAGVCADGVEANIQVTGGAGPFEIREYPSGVFVPLNGLPVSSGTPNERNHQFPNLPFDTEFTFEVIDLSTNCTDIQTLTPPSSPSTINIALVENPVTCVGNADGSIDYTITGYQGTELTYSIYRTDDLNTPITGSYTFTPGNPDTVASGGTATGNVSDFGPGTYLFRVEETDGGVADPCNAAVEFTIVESPTPLTYVDTAITPGNCNALSQGVVTLSGGTTPYGYLVVEDGLPNPGTYGSSNVVTLDQNVNLNWDLYVTDANGCVLGPIDLVAQVTPDPTIDNISAVVDPCVFDGAFEFTVTATGQSQLQFGIDDGDTGTADAPVFVNGTLVGPNQYEYTYTVSGPSVDQYTITVRDANGCTDVDAVVIYPELIVDANFTVDPTCTNSNSGTVEATVSGGSATAGNWTVILFDTDAGADTGLVPVFTAPGTYTFNPVPTGNYEVRVTDAVSTCSAADAVSRAPLVDPIISTTVEEISCIGSSDGSILVSIQSGTDLDGPYTYELYENNGGTQGALITSQVGNPLFTGLSFDALGAPYPTAGEYLVVVSSSLGCVDSEAVTLINPTDPIATLSATAYSCSGAAENFPVITVDNFAGGSGTPYRISYTDPSGNVSGPATPGSLDIDTGTAGIQILADEAGNYDFTIYDSNNCSNNIGIINIPAFPIMTDAVVNQVTPIDCATNTEEVTVTVTGGSGPYDFVEINGSGLSQIGVASGGATTTSGSFLLPGVGTYQFRVTDQATGCSILTSPYEVLPYDTIDGTIAVVAPPIACFGDATGSIELTVTGHTGAYDYVATNTTTGNTVTGSGNTASGPLTITGLESGNIQVTVTDPVSTCNDVTNTVFIAQPEQLTLALVSNDNGYCTADGVVVVDADGGTSPYTYTATDVPFGGTLTVTNSTGEFDLPGTIAGTQYEITVTDANGCSSTPASLTETVFLTEDPTLDPLTVDDVCTHNGSYAITATGTSNVASPPGTGALRFQLGTGSIVDANNGLISHIFTVSTPGTYTVTAYDENGCPTNMESITILPELIATADYSADPTCRDFDGTVTVTVTGGSDFSTNPGNFTFVLNGTDSGGAAVNITQSGAGGNIFTGISAGTYTVTVTDTNIPGVSTSTPCSVTVDVPQLPVPVDPIITATSTAVSCIGATDGTVTVAIDPTTDDDGPYTYEIFVDTGGGVPGAQVGGSQIDNPVFTGLPTGDYVVLVTSDRLCDGTTLINVPNATQVVATATQSAYGCAADNSEIFPIITVTIQDGRAPYTVTYTTPSGDTVTAIDVVDADGGTPGVQYEILADQAGNYTINVTDFNGCTTSPVSLIETVSPFPVMTNPTVTVDTPITCPAGEDVTVRIEGGAGGNYDFEEITGTGLIVSGVPFGTNDDGATAQTETGAQFTLPGVGVYIFEITDLTTGCSIRVTHEIAEFNLIDVVAVQETPESCYQDGDGTIRITITGYTGDFDYTVIDTATGLEATDINGNPIATATGSDTATSDPYTIVLPFTATTGNYIVQIEETNTPFCITTSNVVTIDGPAIPVDLTITPINDTEFCNPAANGAFQASVTGARGTVTYQLARASAPATIIATNTTGLFEGLTADTYEVTVIDDLGTFTCTDTETFTINPPADDVAATLTTTDISCFGAADGSITVNATGTDGPFVYTITPLGGTESGEQTSNVFNFLTANDYTITVYDTFGCTTTAVATINEPNEVTVNIDNVTLVTCAINTIDVTVSGNGDFPIRDHVLVNVTDNNNPVETVVTTNASTYTFINLPAGQYQFYVVDVNGCRSQLSTVVPVIPIDDITFELDLSAANVNCTDEASGIVDIADITGGIGDYRFQLTNNTTGQVFPGAGLFQSESQFTDLPPGDYTYLVESDRGCSATRNFTIVNPPLFERIDPQVNDVICFGEDNGSIIVFAQGGTPPYSFAISTDPGRFFNDASDNVPNQHTFTELTPGTYQVFSQDANGCGQVYDIVIGEPDELQVAIDGQVSPETCAGDMDGSVTITVTGGTPPYSTNITNNDPDFVQDLFTYDMLPGGQTIIYVRDANGCRTEIAVNVPPGVVLGADLAPRLECPVFDYTDPENPVMTQGPRYFVNFELIDGSVTTDITYMLQGINGTPDPNPSINFDGEFEVVPGEYEGTMEHIDGCVEVVGTILIEAYQPLSVPVATMTNNPQDPNEYEISVTGGIPPYTFYVTFEDEGVERELDGNIFTVRDTGNYIIRVEDSSGSICSVTGTQELTYINIRIPNYFTPGEDDPSTPDDESTWYPRQITSDQDPNNPSQFFFENMEVKVFDRYGRLLKEFRGYSKGWDGVYQGKELPSGDYWYTVILNDIDNRKFTGNFTLYR